MGAASESPVLLRAEIEHVGPVAVRHKFLAIVYAGVRAGPAWGD
jgi:hypothetical protein